MTTSDGQVEPLIVDIVLYTTYYQSSKDIGISLRTSANRQKITNSLVQISVLWQRYVY